MTMIAKIKRMHFREKLSISKIARRTSLSRNIINAQLNLANKPSFKAMF